MVITISQNRPKIFIIHENDKWMEPLREAFQCEGVDVEEWNLGLGGEFDLSSPPPQGIFYNRMSASSHTRGHRYAIEHTHAVLEWLELYGRKVVNNSTSLLLEQSKIRQYSAFERAGIKTPRTVIVSGNYETKEPAEIKKLVDAARKYFPNTPFISKHNRSGRGLGVRLWNDCKYFENYLEKEFFNELPVDGIMLLQQYVDSPHNSIIRCEFVDGKFLYAVKVNTSDGFELCPADNCSIIQNFKTKFEILKDFHEPILHQLEKFVQQMKLDICGIEIIADSHGNYFAYDLNCNTNYNSAAERRTFGGPHAMPTIARFLIEELNQLESPLEEPVESNLPSIE